MLTRQERGVISTSAVLNTWKLAKLIAIFNLVKNKLKMATCLEKKPSFENCSPLGLVRVSGSLGLHAVCDGAQDIFQSVSTCYFGSPVYWPMLKVAASLIQDEPDDENDTTVVPDVALQTNETEAESGSPCMGQSDQMFLLLYQGPSAHQHPAPGIASPKVF